MAFLLGSFTSGLFGGMRDMTQILNGWEDLKTKRLLNQAGDETQKRIEAMPRGDTSLPKGSMEVPPISKSDTSAPDKFEEPDLDSVPPPKFMTGGAMKSATAADEKNVAAANKSALTTKSASAADEKNAAAAAMTPTTTPPNYLPPSATAADEANVVRAVPLGTMIWTADKGLHPAQAGESGVSISSVGGAIGNAVSSAFGGVDYDPSRGLYSSGSVVGQQPTPAPAPAQPTSPGLALFPSAVAGQPPAMQPSADFDFQQKRRENMFAIFPSQR